jgi:hypothetical protein
MTQNIPKDEMLQGGVVSPNLVRGYPRGYALYMTNKRVIGVKKPKVGIMGLIAPRRVGPVGGLVTENATMDDEMKMIREIDAKKDFEMRWDSISRIDFKKPGILVGGHVILTPSTGEPVTVKIGTKKDFEIVLNLMRNFLPQAVNFP